VFSHGMHAAAQFNVCHKLIQNTRLSFMFIIIIDKYRLIIMQLHQAM